MARRTFFYAGGADNRVNLLEQKLEHARMALLLMAPAAYQRRLWGAGEFKSRLDVFRWAEELAEELAEDTKPYPGQTHVEMFGKRANCPLCGSTSQNIYHEGFLLPEGLRRHLAGYGNVRICPVMEAAREIILDRHDARFTEAAQAEARIEEQERQRRLANEPLFCGGPGKEPELFTDGWSVRKAQEGKFGVEWAEQRLQQLGFTRAVERRVRSYTKAVSLCGIDHVVYADPRSTRHITFSVFTVTGKKPKKVNRRFIAIRDTWVHNLQQKLDALITEAVSAN